MDYKVRQNLGVESINMLRKGTLADELSDAVAEAVRASRDNIGLIT